MTIGEEITCAIQNLAGAGVPDVRLDAELLLSHILKKDRAWIFTHFAETLDGGSAKRFHELIERRARREPLQYIVGTQEFWGLEFRVSPDVLIPRPETELLVESAIHMLNQTPQPAIVDVCTGSGCIAVSLAKELTSARIFATDISERALALARENARKHGVIKNIRFLEGDLFQPLEELDVAGRVDMITANPPYIPVRDLPSLQPEVRDHEPEGALIAGAEGTEFHRRIVAQAAGFLTQRGVLMMEMGIGQSEPVSAMIRAAGAFESPEVLRDLAGIDRVVVARKKTGGRRHT